VATYRRDPETECNRCGQCCGADGSPNQANPWPVNWLESHYEWGHTAFNDQWPYAILFGLIPDGDGKPVKSVEHSMIRVTGQGGGKYYYVWVDGRPCKDISASHDGTSHSLECPFMKDDPGDGSRPCGLAGSAARLADYMTVCYPEAPDEFPSLESVQQWHDDHPLCPVLWIEVVE